MSKAQTMERLDAELSFGLDELVADFGGFESGTTPEMSSGCGGCSGCGPDPA